MFVAVAPLIETGQIVEALPSCDEKPPVLYRFRGGVAETVIGEVRPKRGQTCQPVTVRSKRRKAA
jgi:hypothetical protein